MMSIKTNGLAARRKMFCQGIEKGCSGLSTQKHRQQLQMALHKMKGYLPRRCTSYRNVLPMKSKHNPSPPLVCVV